MALGLLVRPALLRLAFPRIYQRHDVLNAPKPVGDPCRHSGRHAQRLVHADEIIEHEIQRQRVDMGIDLL